MADLLTPEGPRTRSKSLNKRSSRPLATQSAVDEDLAPDVAAVRSSFISSNKLDETPHRPMLQSASTISSASSIGSSISDYSVFDQLGSPSELPPSPLSPPDESSNVIEQLKSTREKPDFTLPPPKFTIPHPKSPKTAGSPTKVNPIINPKSKPASSDAGVSNLALPTRRRGRKVVSAAERKELEAEAPAATVLPVRKNSQASILADPTSRSTSGSQSSLKRVAQIETVVDSSIKSTISVDPRLVDTASPGHEGNILNSQCQNPRHPLNDLDLDSSQPTEPEPFPLYPELNLNEPASISRQACEIEGFQSRRPKTDKTLQNPSNQRASVSDSDKTKSKVASRANPCSRKGLETKDVKAGRPAFEPYQERAENVDINLKIHDRILKGITVRKVEDKKPGWIYILASDEIDNHVKIGKTFESTEKRKKVWEKCLPELELVQDPVQNPFDYYTIVETLVSIELGNQRKRYPCRLPRCRKGLNDSSHMDSGQQRPEIQRESSEVIDPADVEVWAGTAFKNDTASNDGQAAKPVYHIEWYEVDHQKAQQVVHKWRSWLKSYEPYDQWGNLTPYWKWRLRNELRNISDTRWDDWTQPWRIDFYQYQSSCYGSQILNYGGCLVGHWKRHDTWYWTTMVVTALLVNIPFGHIGFLLVGILSIVA